MALLDILLADVAANKSATASVVQVVNNIVQKLKELQDANSNAVDPVALKVITDELEANTAAIAAAVVAGTSSASVEPTA